MYKTEFETKYFLKTEKGIKAYISDVHTSNDLEELEKYLDEISGYTIIALIEEIERVYTQVPIGKGAKDKANLVKELIQVRLGLGYELHYLLDMLQEEFNAIETAFKELAKYKDHRHRTVMGLYTEKPTY